MKPLTLSRGRQGPFESCKTLVYIANWVKNASMHKLPKQFSTLYGSKMQIFTAAFFGMVTTHNDPSYCIKHIYQEVYNPF